VKIAFSKPTQDDAERQTLFTHFRSSGYTGLQLKYSQYEAYIDQPTSFLEAWGADARAIASGLITGGYLDDAGIADLRRVFKFAQVVGTERIIFCHSQPRQDLSRADIQGYARTLAHLAEEAQQHNTSLSLHHHYNQPVMYRQDFADFFAIAGEQSVKLTIDTAHLVKSGIDDIAAVIRDYHRVIDNIHLKDIAGGDFKLLGQGNIDFTKVFVALHEIGYTGWLCADEESGSNLMDAMQASAQFIHTLGI